MSFRTVKINTRCKLETQLNYLVYRGEQETKINLDEISVLILENQQICITNALLSELAKHNIKVIFCDEKHDPISELVPYSFSYNSYSKINTQLSWDEKTKNDVWFCVVKQKISNQMEVLKYAKKEDARAILNGYLQDIKSGDITNREGLAAKTYFAALFGSSFERRKASIKENKYLDYGYHLILSLVNQEIAYHGYLNQLGIHHKGQTNPFNLACDLMEPFRPFVDLLVVKGYLNDDNYKSELLKLLSSEISCNQKTTIFTNAVYDYVLSALSALKENDIANISNITFLYEQL